jgi:lipopolysaccharide/colanic/teichoic acid biosynthesis glycosyltransferase
MSAPRLRSPGGFLPMAIADAALIVTSFVVASYWTLLLDPYLYFYDEDGAERLVPLVAVMIAAIYIADLYSRRPAESRIYRVQQLSLVAGVALLFEAFLSWVNADAILPRNLMIAGIALSMVSLFVWRTLLEAVLQRFAGPRSVLLVGAGQTLRELADHIAAHPELDLSVAGSVTNTTGTAVPPVLGAMGDLRDVVREVKPDLIIAGVDENREQLPVNDLLDLRFSGATVEDAGAACELICHRVSARDLRPSRVLFTRDFEPNTGQVLILLADLAIASALLILELPLALVWAAILAASGRHPIQRLECAGFRGAPLTTRRFRIPRWGVVSETALALRLDRYPDLWNVLRGKMSMVGPRPASVAVDAELSRAIPVYEYRRNVKPGLASWAELHVEINAPVTDSLREMEYDLYYVRSQSPSLYAFRLLHGFRHRPG